MKFLSLESPTKKGIAWVCALTLLAACDGKPSGVSDEFYEKYKQLGAPKILYQCNDEVGYTAGVGIHATYNKILKDAKVGCWKKFKVLESKQ